MSRLRRTCVLFVCCFQQYAAAEIIGVAGGLGPPPATLGPYEMTRFAPDDRPLWEWVSDVPSPLGGAIEFSVPLQHLLDGTGWAYWGHGYGGDIYAIWWLAYSVTMELPEDTRAIYFYASQYLTSYRLIIAMADDGTTIEQIVHPTDGAKYFGFYQDDPAGPPIQWIEVYSPTAHMVAVGEFGIAIPGAGALALLAVGGIGALSGRRRP